jgi:hypothetical protein
MAIRRNLGRRMCAPHRTCIQPAVLISKRYTRELPRGGLPGGLVPGSPFVRRLNGRPTYRAILGQDHGGIPQIRKLSPNGSLNTAKGRYSQKLLTEISGKEVNVFCNTLSASVDIHALQGLVN